MDPYAVPTFDDTEIFDTDETNPSKMLAALLSPTDAANLSPAISQPPPVTPAQSGPGQSTPQTGNLAVAPQQATPKNADLASQAAPASSLNINGPSTLKARWNSVLKSANAPASASSQISPSAAPDLGTPSSPTVVAPRGTLQGDTAYYNKLQNEGPGVDQIKNPVLRDLGKVADIGETLFLPQAAMFTPGTTLNHERLVSQAAGRVSNDQDMAESRAKIDAYRAQQAQRQADADKYSAQADADRPYNISAADAQSIGHPELVGSPMTPRQLTALQVAKGKNDTTTATHTGGQSHTVSSDDAAFVGVPALAGETLSNDSWQRLVSGKQRNDQSGANNTANNRTRVQTNAATNAARVETTGMRDSTSAANSQRVHPGGAGAGKPIPAGVRDRIESQKNTAISKARSDFDSGVSSMDDYLNSWQQAQDDYEQRVQAQTGQPVPHLDIRSNVDSKGNWIAGRKPVAQPAAAQPQQHDSSAFVTRQGTRGQIGDSVTVSGRKGTITGFNPRTGKAQVAWGNAQ